MQRLVIIEDQTAIREMLVDILRTDVNFELVGECGDGREALALCLRVKPDVIVLDASLPGLNGVDVLRRLNQQFSRLRVLVFSGHENPVLVREMLEAGAHGFVEKTAGLFEFKKGLETVAKGGTYFGPAVAGLLRDVIANPSTNTNADFLTDRSRRRTTSAKLEDMLVAEGLLSAEQLNRIHYTSRPAGMTVQDYIRREGLVADHDMVNVLSSQLRIQKYDPDLYKQDPELGALLPASLAGKHQAVPLCRRGNLLLVATPNPTDVLELDAVQRHVKLEVEPVICTEAEFNELMGSLYGLASGLTSLAGDIEEVDYGAASYEDEGDVNQEAQVKALMDMAEGSAAVRSVNWIITRAVREGASDVHIAPEKTHVQVRLRVDGNLKDLPPIPRSMHLSVVSRLKILGRMDIAVTRVPQDGRFTARLGGREINVRVSSLPTIYGETMVLRLLDMNALVFKLDQLGMGDDDVRKIERAIERPHGMILNTGPTGSGKTTTLYSVLAMLNQPDVNIITVEDPVEYRIARIRQVELNTRAGMTFASSLRSMLRQDPDIVMVGEIRDAETASIAIQASLTGHLVLSTVHTNNAVGTITRLIDMGIEPFLIASVLTAVIAQRLVRRVCPTCAEPWEPPAAALEFWGLKPDPEAHYVREKGCHRCRQTGYRGRTGVYEVLLLNEELSSLIARRAGEAELLAAARAGGNYVTLREDAAAKIRGGVTTLEEAAANVAL